MQASWIDKERIIFTTDVLQELDKITSKYDEKRAALLPVLHFVQEREGLGVWRDLLTALPDQERGILDGMLVASGWYPIAVWNRLMEAILEWRDPRYLLGLARHIAFQDLNVVFKYVLKLGSPEFVIRRFGLAFKQYFNSATLESHEELPSRWNLTLNGSNQVDEAPGEAVCTVGMQGWVLTALERSGILTGHLEKTGCRFHGAPTCSYLLTW